MVGVITVHFMLVYDNDFMLVYANEEKKFCNSSQMEVDYIVNGIEQWLPVVCICRPNNKNP